MDINDIRKQNLRELESRYDLKKDFAEAIGVTAGYVVQMKSGMRPISEKTARGIEHDLSLPKNWMDTWHSILDGVELPQDDRYVQIPWLNESISDASNSADQGRLKMKESVKQAWIDDNDYQIESLRTLLYSRDNMSRTYLVGDRLIINTTFNEKYVDDTVYAFWHADGDPILLRVYWQRTGGLLLVNDNRTQYPDEVVANDQIGMLKPIGTIARLIRDKP